MSKEGAPIYVIKRKKGHAAHHGGAWKVAYADFVTAMMALFIVLWLLSSSEEVQKAVGGYFNDPNGTGKLGGTATPSTPGSAETVSIGKDDMDQLKEKLELALQQLPKFDEMKEQVQMTVTGEGLRIELMETDKGMFFESGSANSSPNGRELLESLARNIGKLPNEIVIEGHTDSKPYSNKGAYSNWELSADRANSSRRFMETSGLRQDQVKQVRGFADQQLRKTDDPENASNRRVSVIVKYLKAPPLPPGKANEKKDAKKEEKKAEPAKH
jgi:chemotaxis protein MotB